MESLISKLYDSLERGEYYKVIDMAQLIFNLIAPSYSYIFLYERHLFKEIDNFQLILLCVILNAILLFSVWTMVKIKTKLKEELKNEEDRLDYIKIASYSNLESQLIVSFGGIFTWANYFYNVVLGGEINIEKVSVGTITFFIAFFIFYTLEGLYISIKLKKFNDFIGFLAMTSIFVMLMSKVLL